VLTDGARPTLAHRAERNLLRKFRDKWVKYYEKVETTDIFVYKGKDIHKRGSGGGKVIRTPGAKRMQLSSVQ